MSALVALILSQDPAGLIDVLRDGTLEERDAAETALRTLGDAAIAPLEAAAGDAEFRVRARRVLSALGATRALIEDLRSDLVPGNARRARGLLAGRTEAVDLLRAALESDDDQQAIQAAALLFRLGETPKAPDLLERSVAAFARAENRDYEIVATDLMLRLAAATPSEEVERAFARALRGVPAHAISGEWEPTPLGRALEVARDRKLPLPAALIRHALVNLRHDERGGNATLTRWMLEKHKVDIRPYFETLVRDPDAQARAIAIDTLLEWKAEPLPEGSVAALAEQVGRNSAALPRLLLYGEAAVPALAARLGDGSYVVRFAAADGLLTLAPDAWRESVIALARPHLDADGFRGNAKGALRLLVRCEAVAELRRALLSRDEQAVACAAVGLAALKEEVVLTLEARRRLYRFAARTWGHDEENSAVAALIALPELWSETAGRLRTSGQDGLNRLETLAGWREARMKDPWPGR